MKELVAAAWLAKLARHLALLTLLAVLFKASGWADPGQAGILLLAVSASVAHLGARMADKGARPKRVP
jgi:hypothetical protein